MSTLEVPAVVIAEIRRQIDSIINGGGPFRPRKEVLDVSALSDDEVLSLWRETESNPFEEFIRPFAKALAEQVDKDLLAAYEKPSK